MGDSFTLAGYVVTVGALSSGFLFARHFPECKCWKNRETTEGVTTEEESERHVESEAITQRHAHCVS
jgi:hypothetical protein